MLFSGIATAAGIGVDDGVDGAPLPVATDAERRDKRTAAIISAAIRTTGAPIIQRRPFFSRTTGAVPFRACRNFCGTSGLPKFSVLGFPTETPPPRFPPHSRSGVENQRHAVSSWYRDEPPIGLRGTDMFRFANDPIQQLQQPSLLGRYQLGVADNVDKEHIGDLHFDLLVNFGGHLFARIMRKFPLTSS